MKWIKKEAGEYRSECGTWYISKTHSRSGWRVYNRFTKFHGYESTLAKAKNMAEFNASATGHGQP